MNDIQIWRQTMPTPIEYYEIVSKALGPSRELLVIGASINDEDDSVYLQAKVEWDNDDKDLQLWERRQRPQGGFVLVNKRRGTCISRLVNENGASLHLANAEMANVNDLHAWNDDHVQGTYNAINSAADWEQKINIPGNGPYQPGQQLISWEWDGGSDNELWCFQASIRKFELLTIVFELDKGNLIDQTPTVVSSQTLVNTSSVEQGQSVDFRFIETHRFGFSFERGFKIGGSIETTAKIPLIGESKVKIQAETHFKWTTDSETSEESEVGVSIPVKVPPNSAVNVEAILLQGRLDVPYRAELRLVHWDGQTTYEQTWGVFSGVNAYNVITRVTEYPVVERTVFRKLRSLSGAPRR